VTDAGHQTFFCEEQGSVELPFDLISPRHGAGVDLDDEVAGRGFFSLSLKGKNIELYAKGFVGLFRLNERCSVVVRPRSSLANLAEIVSIAGTDPEWLVVLRFYETGSQFGTALGSVYAQMLIRLLANIEQLGTLRRYSPVITHGSAPIGRIRISTTMRRFRSRGKNHIAEFQSFSRGANVPENRLLLEAVNRLTQCLASGSPEDSMTSNRLRKAAQFLVRELPLGLERSGVDHDLFIDPNKLPDHRRHYFNAISVANAVIQRSNILFEYSKTTSLELPSVVVNMNSVFEDFIVACLKQGPGFETPGGYTIKSGNSAGSTYRLLDSPQAPLAKPDILVCDLSGKVQIVVDAKNVPSIGWLPAPAVQQVLAYGVRFGTSVVLLAQPAKNEASTRVLSGFAGAISVTQYAISLDSADLSQEINRFNEFIFSMFQRATSEVG
jgi:5-methylcytosine-specific restriction enzyme subunit McrC